MIATVASGSAEEINGLWQRGKQAMDDINAKKPDYKAVDVAYELGHPTGGDIQNSNSTIFTIGRKMGLPLNSAIQDAGLERKFPGWGRDLLDLKRRPFVGEPPLAVRAAP